jgi:hypothetical protein
VIASQLDAEYDQGTVSSALVLEHLGARDYEQLPRADGGPGSELVANGLRAIQFIGITPSPSLVGAVTQAVRDYDMQRTILLQGADAPGSTVPSHCNFGGEGTPYNVHLLPTIGVISAPQSLYDPAFGLEGIDFNVMHEELLGYTELLNRLGTMSQAEVAGEIPRSSGNSAARVALHVHLRTDLRSRPGADSRASARRALGHARAPRRGRAHLGGARTQPADELALGFGGLARDATGQVAVAALHDPVVARGLRDGEVVWLVHRGLR